MATAAPMGAKDVALVSQMRAGTHYMCAALRLALEAALMRPKDGGRYGPMADFEILKDLHPDSRFDLPPPRPQRHIYFSHYYHPHHESLPDMPRISLIGLPPDSFYSDGVVYADADYSAGPSASRPHADSYVFRRESKEWKKLEQRMCENALWLDQLSQTPNNLIVRYEDLYLDFAGTSTKVEDHVGGFLNPMPQPRLNRQRTYWTRDFSAKFDAQALAALNEIFGKSIIRFYPECASALRLG